MSVVEAEGGILALPRRLLRWGESTAVVVILLLMALIPVAESLVRRFTGLAIPGASLYVQHLTLWAGFVGALLAAGTRKHLSLATGTFLPEGRFREAAAIFVGGLSAGICALLAWASAVMVRADAMQPRALPGGLPEWVSELVMPVTLALMAIRFAWWASERSGGRIAAFAIGLLVALLGPACSNHPTFLLWPGSAAILLGLLLGSPVFIAMGGLAMLLFFSAGTPIASVPVETYRLVASSTLPAIPLLTAAGFVLAEGGASRRLLRLARAVLGWAPGGLAFMVVIVLAGFTAFTGGSGVTILALGGLVLPMLVEEGYGEGFSLGLVTSSGSLGLLFPPSLPVILYAVVAGASVENLFIAGLVPGLLMVVLVAFMGMVVGVRKGAPRQPLQPGEAVRALWTAKWELAIPTLVVSAVFTGFATLVEAAALALILAIVSQAAVFRDLRLRHELPDVLVRGSALVGAVILLLGMAMGLTSYLVDAEVPAAVLTWTKAHIHSPTVFLLVLNAVLLVLGSILEIYSAVIILAPLLAPLALAYGIDPLHLGIVFLANLELGFLFPPMGLNLILASTRFGQPLTRLWRVTLPFLLVRAVGVLLVTYLPAITTGVLAKVKPATAKPPAVGMTAP
jgi:tripartite ATP-independent transporter DctM subunit